jgi:hypothetical protein
MKTPIGTDVVGAIQQLLEEKMLSAQADKQEDILEVLGDFVRNYGVPAQNGPVTALARLLRSKDPETIRQVRSMSDALLLKDERELEEELDQLRSKLSPIEATFHQVKTKNAFIYTVLRPFSPKFTDRWFEERTDIDAENLGAVINRLEHLEISNLNKLTEWTEEVSLLFEQLVVYRGQDAGDYYARPGGTVSLKSSRTYLQAWIAFTKTSNRELWSVISGDVIARKSSKSSRYLRDKELIGFEQAPPRKAGSVSARSLRASKEKPLESFSLMMAPPQTEDDVNPRQAPPVLSKPKLGPDRSTASRDNVVNWVQIFIESKIDPSAQATRKWASQSEFKQSLQKWLDTLPVIWGPAAAQFVAKVSVKTASGESDLTLPSLTVKDAADRLTKAVEMQQD